ncbi:hypothetical protein KC321_g15 [Hortaea werneckii]|nr:hypothetical protein KC321_g15 [Hortaea werneckii]
MPNRSRTLRRCPMTVNHLNDSAVQEARAEEGRQLPTQVSLLTQSSGLSTCGSPSAGCSASEGAPVQQQQQQQQEMELGQ